MAEVYSALSHTQRIRDIELELNDALQDYIEEQETRLAAIKRFATEVKHSVDLSAEGSPGSYIGHPVNMYLMIKRFVNEWPQVEKVVEEQSNSEAFLLDRLASSKSKFPTSEDLTGAITAIKRLQEVYALKPVDFSEGRFGFKPKTGYLLGPKDTYKIGRESYLDGDMVGTAEWMTETLRLMDLGVSNGAQAPRRTDVLDHLAFAEFKCGVDIVGLGSVGLGSVGFGSVGFGSVGFGCVGLGCAGLGYVGLGIVGLGSAGLCSVGLGSAGLGSVGLGSAVLGSVGLVSSGLGSFGLGSVGLGSAGLGSVGLGSVELGSAGLGSAGLGSVGLGSAGLGSVGLGSVGLGSVGLGSVELDSVGLGSVGLGSAGLDS
ncbi:predicted protein, partial [Nematostella vectensis]